MNIQNGIDKRENEEYPVLLPRLL